MTREEATIQSLMGHIEAIEETIKTLKEEICTEYDKDHIWYKGKQYISLRRFLEVKVEADKEHETVTEFADRCRECGAKYGKLLKQKSKNDWVIEEQKDIINEAYLKANSIDAVCGFAYRSGHIRESEELDSARIMIFKLIDYIKENEDAEMDELDFKRPKKIVGKLISVEVFDKIKDEIVEKSYINFEDYKVVDLDDALQIINKYREGAE